MPDSVAEMFQVLESRIDPARVAGMNAVFQFCIPGEKGGDWNVAITQGAPKVSVGKAANPGITISMSPETFMDVVHQRISGQMAFMTGRIRLQGDISLAMKLKEILGAP